MNTCCGNNENNYQAPPRSTYFYLGELPENAHRECGGHRSVRDMLDRYIYMENKPAFFFKDHGKQGCYRK